MSDGDSNTSPQEQPKIYAIRFEPQARQEAIDAAIRFAQIAGAKVSEEWIAGLEVSVSALATNPRRQPLIPESRHFAGQEIRQLLYRRTSSSAAYRLLFAIEDQSDDGPTVTIIHVRHASAKPIGRKEAREIQARETDN